MTFSSICGRLFMIFNENLSLEDGVRFCLVEILFNLFLVLFVKRLLVLFLDSRESSKI